MTPVADFYDLPTLLRLRDAVSAADPDAEPGLWVLGDGPAPRRLGLLAGSFNPPHIAHLALARAALASGLDTVLLVLSKRTVDKERVAGLALEDRLLLLRLLARETPGLGVALVNRGLYVDQAAIARRTWPDLERLDVILGFDKIVQVFDPKYYADRDAALDELFALADALVAPREGADDADLAALLDQPANRRYRAHVRPLRVAPDLADLSSSALRRAVAGGAGDLGRTPELVRDFVAETRAYAPARLVGGEKVDDYGLRVALVEALARERPLAASAGDLRALLRAAQSDDATGRRLRAWLREGGDGSGGGSIRDFLGAPR